MTYFQPEQKQQRPSWVKKRSPKIRNLKPHGDDMVVLWSVSVTPQKPDRRVSADLADDFWHDSLFQPHPYKAVHHPRSLYSTRTFYFLPCWNRTVQIEVPVCHKCRGRGYSRSFKQLPHPGDSEGHTQFVLRRWIREGQQVRRKLSVGSKQLEATEKSWCAHTHLHHRSKPNVPRELECQSCKCRQL